MSFIIKVLGEPLLFFFLDPFSKMNKPVKSRRREGLPSEHYGETPSNGLVLSAGACEARARVE